MAKKPSVAEELMREGYRFDFYKAAKLLEMLMPEATELGEGTEPEDEPAQLRAKISTAFPASAIEQITPATPDDPRPVMETNFLGIAGAHGPLPPPYTELIQEHAWRGDTAMRDFLDIFNHRLLSLLYRARKTHRPGVAGSAPWHGRHARFLFSLFGMGTAGLQHRMQIDDHALLFYSGLLVHHARSIPALEAMLLDYFQVPIRGVSFVGQWYSLPPEEHSTLGMRGQNQLLGVNAMAGTKVWDQQGKFAVDLGPLSFKEYLNFLPIGWGFIPLCELTRFYVGQELDFDIRLRLKAEEVPESRLGGKEGARLSWKGWLKTQEFKHGPEITLSPKSLFEKKLKTRIPLLWHLPQTELEEVMSKMKIHHIPVHTMLLRQGETGDSLFFIDSGAVQVARLGLDNTQRILATLEAGDVFGEFSLFSNQPRSASVTTISDAKILELNGAVVRELMASHPRIEETLTHLYQQRKAQGT